jgi:hypothetical protein
MGLGSSTLNQGSWSVDGDAGPGQGGRGDGKIT